MAPIRAHSVAMPKWIWAIVLLIGAGCADKHDEIPPDARLYAQGEKTITAVAPSDGMVYIWDKDANEMVYTGDVKKGDSVTVDADAERVVVDGRTAVEKRIHKGNTHHIFFEADRETRARQARDSDGVVVEERVRTTEERTRPSGETVEEERVRTERTRTTEKP